MSSAGYRRSSVAYPFLPQVGCLLTLLVVAVLGLASLLVAGSVPRALARLHLSGPLGLPIFTAIVLGGLINVPLYRRARNELQRVDGESLISWLQWIPGRRSPFETVIAVNVGAGIALLLAAYEATYVLADAWQVQLTCLVAVAANVLLCHQLARPVDGAGLVLPPLVAPLAAVGVTWMLLGGGDDYRQMRACCAFIAGVLGPILGAHLLRLADLDRTSTGVFSVGGAGTFDSVLLAAVGAASVA
jgi:uncharacterized membrane protein